MQSAPLAGTATTVTVVFMVLVLDAIRTPRGDGNTSSKSFLSVARRCNPQTPSHLPIPSRFASANRGASSKAARFFRHRRRFASFPSRGRQLPRFNRLRAKSWMQSAPLAGTATCGSGDKGSGGCDAIRRHHRTCRFPAALRLPIGVLPRKRLASSATGGASPLSSCGDGNALISLSFLPFFLMQSAPPAGTATITPRHRPQCHPQMQSAPVPISVPLRYRSCGTRWRMSSQVCNALNYPGSTK